MPSGKGASLMGSLGRMRPPSWFTPAIATDWLLSLVFLLVDRSYLRTARPFQQPLEPFLDDPSLQYRHVIYEHVPGDRNTWLTFMLPLGAVLVVSIVRRSLKEAHHAALGLWAGHQLNEVATNFVKLLVGRLRPDFFDRCQYDKVAGVCTGLEAIVQEGRRSFPSGHSSSAFFGCVFLMLFLAGKSRCFAFSSTLPNAGIFYSRFLRTSIAISPLFLSSYVAISRWEDHWHHPTDIMAGSILGTVIALVTYHIWWPSPFSSANFETMGFPRKTHVELEDSIGYEGHLGVDDDEESLGEQQV